MLIITDMMTDISLPKNIINKVDNVIELDTSNILTAFTTPFLSLVFALLYLLIS